MIFVTGDTHGSFSHIASFCRERPELGADDVMILLGDTGLNYYGDERDIKKKTRVANRIPMTLLCVHGNHDMRPEGIPSYGEMPWNGGIVYCDSTHPRILFAKDGSRFLLDGRSTVAVGGAYSIDKAWRLQKGYRWFPDEQPSNEVRLRTETELGASGWQIDTMLTHTCPLKYEPVEAFFSNVDQHTVDKETERWLDGIENRLQYRRWFCGHFHIDKRIDRMHFLYKEITAF